ncbi:MAG: hypothetical protein IJQ28_02140, partial [Clostridia bacterium]|nr:hypothetical protein [Clostridia bacterium]
MKKVIFILSFMSIILGINVYAISPSKMIFSKDTDGKYIYCNNREFIYREDLADNSNDNPKYIMNNDNLAKDKYTIFISHVNHTELRDENRNITEAGFDIEVDVLFKADTDTEIIINSLGFEVPQNIKYYLNGNTYNDETDWGCFNAWASYLGFTINQKDSSQKYYPYEFEPVKINIKAGEKVWLSTYIDNYCAVPFYKPVHIISDFEIVSGQCDVNVAAIKSNGTLKDRSNLSDNIARGTYIYDRQYKGISYSKNKVNTSLNYTINDEDYDGTLLPVTVYNQFAPNGNTVTTWYTNLNPKADPWNKDNVAEDSMLALYYKDSSKLDYYGMSSDSKDDVWVFDTYHTDLKYDYNSTKLAKNFKPNYLLTKKTLEKYACNLANYGVFYNYNITVKNEGNIDRYLSYKLKTPSNNIVILYDEDGNIAEGYPLAKGFTNGDAELDTMVNIYIPAQKTTVCTISVILTTNYVGGMENKLVINNFPTAVETYSYERNYDVKDNTFTGNEYVKWKDGILYKSYDGDNWEKTLMNESTSKLFEGQWNEYVFTATKDGYFAKNTIYDGTLYDSVKNLFNKVYILDKDFNYLYTVEMYSYPKEFSKTDSVTYVNTDTKYYSENNGGIWKNFDALFELPKYNMGSFVACYGNKTINLSTTGIYFKPVIFDDFSVEYLQTLGNLYYFVKENVIYYSYDGVYWNKAVSDTKIKKLAKNSKEFIVNDNIKINILEYNNDIVIRFEDIYLGLSQKPLLINGKTYVPLNSFTKLA